MPSPIADRGKLRAQGRRGIVLSVPDLAPRPAPEGAPSGHLVREQLRNARLVTAVRFFTVLVCLAVTAWLGLVTGDAGWAASLGLYVLYTALAAVLGLVAWAPVLSARLAEHRALRRLI